MSKLVLVQFENTIVDVDTALTEMYAKQFSKEAELQSLESLITGKSTTPRKVLHKISNLINTPDFYLNLEPVEGAKEILQDIYHYAESFPEIIDLRLCIASHPYKGSLRFESESFTASIETTCATITQKLTWIERVYGTKFLQKVVIMDDTNPYQLIPCDYYISTKNVPNTGKFTPIMLSRPYNIHVTDVNRLKQWKKWKTAFQLTISSEHVIPTSEDENIKSFVHGSKDSTDIDRLYLFPGTSLPSHKQCVEFVHSSGTEDRNMFVIGTEDDQDTGYVKECFKGSADELNNAFFTTYHLHEQTFPLPIRAKINRCVPLKCCNTLLSLLVKVRRSSVRDAVVKALRGYDFDSRRACLKSINYETLAGQLNPDDIKFCAFRLGQTLGLVQGKELFTKQEISEYYPDLRALLYRESQDLKIIERYKNMFLEAMSRVKVVKSKALHMFVFAQDVTNWFEAQSNGMIIDMKEQAMSCVMWPLEHAHELPCDWNVEPEISMNSATTHVFKHEGQIYITGHNKFENKMLTKKEVENLPLENFDFIFKQDDTVPFAQRSKLTNRIKLF
jgi:hypothetical protein